MRNWTIVELVLTLAMLPEAFWGVIAIVGMVLPIVVRRASAPTLGNVPLFLASACAIAGCSLCLAAGVMLFRGRNLRLALRASAAAAVCQWVFIGSSVWMFSVNRTPSALYFYLRTVSIGLALTLTSFQLVRRVGMGG
jgi:hypothetical protein